MPKKFDWEKHFAEGGTGVMSWQMADPSLAEFIPVLKERGCKLVLDLGCGLGRVSVLLAEQGFEVVASDISPSALAKTEKRLSETRAKNYRAVKHDMYGRFPFTDNYFDAVVSLQTIHHNKLAKIKKTVAEIRRVLRGGGIAFITVLSTKHWSYGLGKEIEKDTFIRPEGVFQAGETHHHFDKSGIKELFADFNVLKLEERVRIAEGKPRAVWVVAAEK